MLNLIGIVAGLVAISLLVVGGGVAVMCMILFGIDTFRD